MNRILLFLLTIFFWIVPLVAQAYTYDPRVYSPRYPQCMEEYNKCDEPCLTQMGGNASYACHNVCAANFDKCVAGDSQRENVEDISSQYRLKQKCDNLRSSCELYTCDKFHGMAESRACFESCKVQADQCMAASGLAPQSSANWPEECYDFGRAIIMDVVNKMDPLERVFLTELTCEEVKGYMGLSKEDKANFVRRKLQQFTPEERLLYIKKTIKQLE